MIPAFSRACVLAAFGCTSLAAFAADQDLDEVVVTASLSEATLSTLPASVTVLRGEQLSLAGNSTFGDVLGQVPNLGFAGGTSRPRYFQIRGIGELEQYEGAPNPSVGFLIDDIDFSGIAMPAALFDVGQVEVLRGPQGTAYGANAIAGLISLRSQAPVPGFSVKGELEAGNYDTYGGGLVLNNSFGDRTAWRLALHRQVSDGFRHNAFLDRDDTNGFDENLARLRIVSQLNPDLELNVTALVADADNGYDAWAIDNSRTTQSDQPGVDSQLSRAVAVRFDYRGWDGLTLRSITTFAHADMAYSFDGDWGNDVLWGADGPYDFTESIDRTRRNVSQELRLRGAHGGSDWIAGVYALRLDEDYAFLDLYNGDVYRELASDYRALNVAAYGQVDRALSSTLSLSAGVRIERRNATYRDSNALRSSPVDLMSGGHLALTWQVADGRSVYASLTRGYKAGGINPTAADIDPALRNFEPESLWSVEAGLRTGSPASRFDSQTSVFYMRRSHQQVSSSVQADPGNPLDFVLLTDNAARGENAGVETQLGWRPVSSLRLAATGALLRARFLDYELEGRDLDGRDAPHAPSYQFGLSATWHGVQGLFAQAEFQAVDAFYFSASHDERAPDHQLVNLRVGYQAERWTATLYARNLLDEHYAVRGFYFGNEPPDFAAKRYIQNGDPRQLGLRVSFSL